MINPETHLLQTPFLLYRRLQPAQLGQRAAYAVIVNARRHIVGHSLDVVFRVAHSYTRSCPTEDGNIIATVTKGDGLAHVQALMGAERKQSTALVGAGMSYICKEIRSPCSDAFP